MTCPNCSFENPPGFDFCGQCAAALQEDTRIESAKLSAPAKPAAVRVTAEQVDTSALEGERKTVTALFADIKGSTELEQDLDPEEARAIVDPALKLMIDAVQRYDGYIVQSTGDGIFALFGAPSRTRIIRSAHSMRRSACRKNFVATLPSWCATAAICRSNARVGVNTGEVVVRSIATGGGHIEYTPIGHTTNLASRMQAARADRIDRGQRADAQVGRGLFRAQAARTDQSQRRQ